MGSKIMGNKQLLEDLVEWLRGCGQDAFYVFDNTEDAINKFLDSEYFN